MDEWRIDGWRIDRWNDGRMNDKYDDDERRRWLTDGEDWRRRRRIDIVWYSHTYSYIHTYLPTYIHTHIYTHLFRMKGIGNIGPEQRGRADGTAWSGIMCIYIYIHIYILFRVDYYIRGGAVREERTRLMDKQTHYRTTYPNILYNMRPFRLKRRKKRWGHL